MAVVVVKRGVTPDETEIFGVIVPLMTSTPAPLDAVPIEKCVSVALPPVHAGPSMLATGETELAVTVQPPEVLATAVRA